MRAVCKTGSTRASSSPSGSGNAPGRDDSPPMSRMSAPASTSASQCANAAWVDLYCPPSEKESGVTLTMPITLGVAKSIRNPVVCQNMEKLSRSAVYDRRIKL